MKKYLVIAALILVPLTAWAAENIRQKGHGGAVWVQNRDGTTHPVGGVLVTEMSDLASAATKYIRAHKTGNVMAVYSVLQAALGGGNAAVTIMSNNSDILGAGEAFTNTGHSLTITASGSAAGDVDSSTVTSATTATRVNQGDVIAIVGDGGPSGNAAATFTVVIE